MRRFFRKRWYGIPIGLVAILLGLSLIGSGVAGAVGGYPFLSFETEIKLYEPLTVYYNLHGQYGGDEEWHLLVGEYSMGLTGDSGDTFAMELRVDNYGDNALTVDTTITDPSGQFTFGGWPDGTTDNCVYGSTTFNVTVTTNGDAPPGEYTINFAFDRS